MERIFTMVFSLLLLLNTEVKSQIDTSITNEFERFKTKNGTNWEIRLNEKTGIPASIHFGKTKPRQGTPEEIAKDFLRENGYKYL